MTERQESKFTVLIFLVLADHCRFENDKLGLVICLIAIVFNGISWAIDALKERQDGRNVR